MAFNPFTVEEIAAGKPTKQELFEKLKDDLDDHEDRLTDLEGAVGVSDPINFDFVGLLDAPEVMVGALHYAVRNSITILAARLLVISAGTSGTCEVDVEYKRGVAAWTSILDAPITAAFGEGDLVLKTGDLTFQDLEPGDLIRVNINSVQDGMEDFHVILEKVER